MNCWYRQIKKTNAERHNQNLEIYNMKKIYWNGKGHFI